MTWETSRKKNWKREHDDNFSKIISFLSFLLAYYLALPIPLFLVFWEHGWAPRTINTKAITSKFVYLCTSFSLLGKAPTESSSFEFASLLIIWQTKCLTQTNIHTYKHQPNRQPRTLPGQHQGVVPLEEMNITILMRLLDACWQNRAHWSTNTRDVNNKRQRCIVKHVSLFSHTTN